jgi:hypothetical protein
MIAISLDPLPEEERKMKREINKTDFQEDEPKAEFHISSRIGRIDHASLDAGHKELDYRKLSG